MGFPQPPTCCRCGSEALRRAGRRLGVAAGGPGHRGHELRRTGALERAGHLQWSPAPGAAGRDPGQGKRRYSIRYGPSVMISLWLNILSLLYIYIHTSICISIYIYCYIYMILYGNYTSRNVVKPIYKNRQLAFGDGFRIP